MMSEHLEDVLNQYLSWLRDNKHPVADALQPGLTQAEIDQLAAGLPFTLTDEIQTFYRWRNGVPNERMSFIPNFSYLPLENAVQTYHELVAVDKQVKATVLRNPLILLIPGNFKPHWFPLFVLSAPDYCFVDCSDKKTKQGNVIEVTEGDFPKVISRNLTLMIEQLLISYRTGRYTVTDEGDFKDSNLPMNLTRRPKVINAELEASLRAAAHDWIFIENLENMKQEYGTSDVTVEIREIRIEGAGSDNDPFVGWVSTNDRVSHPKLAPQLVNIIHGSNYRYLLMNGKWVRVPFG